MKLEDLGRQSHPMFEFSNDRIDRDALNDSHGHPFCHGSDVISRQPVPLREWTAISLRTEVPWRLNSGHRSNRCRYIRGAVVVGFPRFGHGCALRQLVCPRRGEGHQFRQFDPAKEFCGLLGERFPGIVIGVDDKMGVVFEVGAKVLEKG